MRVIVAEIFQSRQHFGRTRMISDLRNFIAVWVEVIIYTSTLKSK